jgi:hypothetical protein
MMKACDGTSNSPWFAVSAMNSDPFVRDHRENTERGDEDGDFSSTRFPRMRYPSGSS